MILKPNYSASETKSSAGVDPGLVVDVTPLTGGALEELSAWIDDRLVLLEEKFADFRTPKSLSASLGRS